MASGVYSVAGVVMFYNPDCSNCQSWPEHMRPFCACCQPELMAAREATRDDVDEAAGKTGDPATFFRGWQMDARKRVAVGTVVRSRRHTPRPTAASKNGEAR